MKRPISSVDGVVRCAIKYLRTARPTASRKSAGDKPKSGWAFAQSAKIPSTWDAQAVRLSRDSASHDEISGPGRLSGKVRPLYWQKAARTIRVGLGGYR